MTDAIATTTKPRTKSTVSEDTPKFTAPSFELPKFELPKFEVPAAFREFAEKGVTQAKDHWEKLKAATEEATDLLEDSYSKASKGATDYSLMLIDAGRTNTNAAFDFAASLMTVKSLSEVIELSTAHARQQFDAVSQQAKDLTTFAQKFTSEAVEPLRESVTSVLKKAA